jgi:hypothetical protein
VPFESRTPFVVRSALERHLLTLQGSTTNVHTRLAISPSSSEYNFFRTGSQ